VTEVHIGQLSSRVEAVPATPADDDVVRRVAAEVTRRLQEAAQLARAATLSDEDLFGEREV
jgi:hypothetical protein